MNLRLTSAAVQPGQAIPAKYTCDGENISPPLQWDSGHPDTRSFVLIVDDPDAPRGLFTHWILFNLPPSMNALPENYVSKGDAYSVPGRNSSGQAQYKGPCPPHGPAHHYHFHLYAIDMQLGLPPGATRDEVIKRMEGHVLEETELIGTYRR